MPTPSLGSEFAPWDVAAFVAAAIAAVAALIALWQHRRTERHRRLIEVADLVDQIRAAIEWGSGAAVRREEFQRRLKTRLRGFRLPKTAALAEVTQADPESLALAREAVAEVEAALGRHSD